ncbi:MAG: TM0996/MTH895 family glutaredoxin-like protein [Oligoflexia bacterium]|nr:TM0996/MTH895 family glutaredoxin-like protein [Oligoflexia bacterium]
MKLQVLGTGCSRCRTLVERVKEATALLSTAADIEKIEDIQAIARFGIMATPALVMDGKVLFSGRVPTTREIAELIASHK